MGSAQRAALSWELNLIRSLGRERTLLLLSQSLSKSLVTQSDLHEQHFQQHSTSFQDWTYARGLRKNPPWVCLYPPSVDTYTPLFLTTDTESSYRSSQRLCCTRLAANTTHTWQSPSLKRSASSYSPTTCRIRALLQGLPGAAPQMCFFQSGILCF